MNVCRVVHAAACAVAFALAVGAADAVTRAQPTAHRALQKDTAVASLGDNFAQTFERKRDPDSSATSPALLSVCSSSFWNHGSISKLPPADTNVAALSKLHCYPDVYQLKDSSAVSYSEESPFVYLLDAGANYQQDGAVVHAPHWRPESRGRSVVLQRRDATLHCKVADVSSQTEWSSSPLDASDASCFNDDCSQYLSDDLLLAPISECDRGEKGAANFSDVFESSSALSVDEINGMLSVLEEIASDALPVPIISSSSSSSSDTASLEGSEHAAQNENSVVDMIPSLEHVETPELFLAEVVDEVPSVFSSPLEENSADDVVTEPAFLVVPTEGSVAAVELLSALEEPTSFRDDSAVVVAAAASGSNLTQPNWIDSLEMDNISSCLFPEMQQPKSATSLPQRDAMASPAATGKIDSRVYVPKFSVRIEGRPPVAAVQSKPFVQSKDWSAPSTAHSPQLPVGSQSFLVGPPPPVFAASSVLSRKDRVERWKEKRRARSFVPRAPNPNLSESRKAIAAKRQRVGGRFIGCGGLTCAPFVAITALQS